MKRINLFYISTILLGFLLIFLLRPLAKEEISFFGFAENQETEINYNYSVVVENILVKPGQTVSKGDTLLKLYRKKSRESLQDQEYKIAELQAEEALWIEKKQSEIADLELEQASKLDKIDGEINELKEELNYRNSLINKLESIKVDTNRYKPLENKMNNLLAEKEHLHLSYEQRVTGIKTELRKGLFPYQSKISLLKAEQDFEEGQQVLTIAVLAPTDGLIGDVFCKEEEHIPSFKTLLTFYEPHSGIVNGYVHEDLILKVNVGDRFMVSSLKDANMQYEGKVVGLGSRIVEIPSRLRKVPEFKTYGREVLVEITMDNTFLQKEKVGLRFMAAEK